MITSSVASIVGGNEDDSEKVFTEEDWTDLSKEGLVTYYKSKTLAEKAFVAKLPTDEKIPLVTINPAVVMGPNVPQDHLRVSTLEKRC